MQTESLMVFRCDYAETHLFIYYLFIIVADTVKITALIDFYI